VKLRFLLDTHDLVRWLIEPRKLSRDQIRVLSEADRHAEPLALSTITLLEIAVLVGASKIDADLEDIFAPLRESPGVRILPLTIPIATEIWALGAALRDPMDRAVVATARVHGLRLLTSDQRIIASKLVSFID
jgi:PIN domain nuclease of toxin-antitoxin system